MATYDYDYFVIGAGRYATLHVLLQPCLSKFLVCTLLNVSAFWAWCSGGVRSSRIAATHLGASGKVAVAGKCIFVLVVLPCVNMA